MSSRLDALLAEQARRQAAPTPSQPEAQSLSRLDVLMAEKARRESQPSSLDASLRGTAQGATLNFGDEIIGAIGVPAHYVSRGLERLVYGDNVIPDYSPSQAYQKERNAIRQANAAAQKAHPYFYGAGEFAGGAIPAFLTRGATTAPSIGRMAATGAGWGAGAGLGASESDDLKGMAIDTGIGATLGGAIGGGLGALSKAAPIQRMKNLGQTIGSFFSDDIAANKANRIIANEITDAGMDTIGARLAQRDAQRMGMGVTLPESLGNERLIRYQHDISKSGTKGADILAQQAEKRATELIPSKVRGVAEEIQDVAGQQADAAYDAIRDVAVDARLDKAARQHPLIKRAIATVENNPVYRSDPLAPNTIGFYDRVKQELDDMASIAIKKGANRRGGIITNVKNQLTSILDNATPEYAEARRLAQRNIGGREIQDALENAQVGSISGFKNALFGTPAKQADILRKLEPHEQKALQDIMGELEKMEKGGLTDALGSSGGALREGVAPREIRAITPNTSATVQMFNWVMDKIHQKNYKALADAFVNPNMSKITQQITNARNAAQKKAAIDTFATKWLSSQAGREGGEPNERTKITITPPTAPVTPPPALEPAPDKGAGNDIPLDIIKEEGLRLSMYKDSEGHPTVGYGFNMDSDKSARKIWQIAGIDAPFQDVKRGRVAITEEQADKLARASYKIAQDDARKVFPNYDKLSPNRQAALANISYQWGANNLSDLDEVSTAIKNGRYNAAANRLARTKWARQTPARAKRIITMLAKDLPYDKV